MAGCDAAVVPRDIREDGLVGLLFEPLQDPRGATLVLGGSRGGVDEALAAPLAEAGFVVLALAYFGTDGLPDQLIEIPIETVERGLKWLRDQPQVARRRVGLLGASKGGELALLAASRFPEHLAAVVGFAASPIVWQAVPSDRRDWQRPPRSSWTADGEPVTFLPYARPGLGAMLRTAGAALVRRPLVVRDIYDRALDNPAQVADATIALERITTPILLVSGTDDRLWPSSRLAELAMQRLASQERPYRDEHLRYEGAGHLAGRPGSAQPSQPTGRSRLAFGGSPSADLAAHHDAWPRILDLLTAQLGDPDRNAPEPSR